MAYWLMKSEPDTYSISDLKRDNTTLWEGVRNYQARNYMTQEMKIGDTVLFYHSNAEPPGIAGLALVSKKAQPDPSCWNPSSPYYDEKSTIDNPRWFCVEVKYLAKANSLLSLNQLRENSKLTRLPLLKKGQRLSIMPISNDDFNLIHSMIQWSK